MTIYDGFKKPAACIINAPKVLLHLQIYPCCATPYWIRHIEFMNFEFGFVISNLNNPRLRNFIQIK